MAIAIAEACSPRLSSGASTLYRDRFPTWAEVCLEPGQARTIAFVRG